MNENPYFEDTKLTKTFTFYDEGTTKITGTNIKWKEGMVMVTALAIFTLFNCNHPFPFHLIFGNDCEGCF
jgi:hypothetical protein